MNRRILIGIVVALAGIGAIAYSIHSMGRIQEAKSMAHDVTAPLRGHPVGGAMGEMIRGQASQYDTQVTLLLIAGIALVVVGGGIALFRRKR